MLKFRVILMGTGGFAVPSFEAIRNTTEIDILSVVTRPTDLDAKSRSKSVSNPVLEWASANSIEVRMPASINDLDAMEWLRSLQADLFVVCDYGQILTNECLSTSRLGGINLHGSLLPRHRGAAPVQWSILRGDIETGVSVIHMTPKLDAGPILCASRTEIRSDENAAALEHRLSELGIQATLKAIRYLQSPSNDDPPVLLQDLRLVTTARRLNKLDGQIDFRYSLDAIDRQIRGLFPWPGVYGDVIDETQKTLRIAIQRVSKIKSTLPIPQGLIGTLAWKSEAALWIEEFTQATENSFFVKPAQLLLVGCQGGFLSIQNLQPSGKKPMSSVDFIAGYCKSSSLRFALSDSLVPHRLLDVIDPSVSAI